MSNKVLNLEEKNFDIKDEKSILLSSNTKRPQTIMHGEVEIKDQFGNLLQKRHNIILLGGRRFTLEKLFNVELPKSKKVTLNNLFGVNTVEPEPTGKGPLQNKEVCLWGVGRGGSELTFGKVNVPAEKEYNLYDQIPLRYVEKNRDLPEEEKQKYYLRVFYKDGQQVATEEECEYIAYYLKRFERSPELVIKIGEEEYFPNLNNDNIPTDWDEIVERRDVDMYIQLTLKLSANDVCEFFIETETIDNARINELGVYFGFKQESVQWSDYLAIENFSKLTFNNEPLDDETKELSIVYKFFI